ncbi:MAG: hypothetical protein AAFW89_13745 [Bacteroidota bacterium]
MSYAVRNTIILLVTVLLIYGAGFAYIKFYQERKISTLETNISESERDRTSKQQISEGYEELLTQFEIALETVEQYDKGLFESNNPDEIYRYITELSSDEAEVYFDYVFEDSVVSDPQYGIIRSNITGYASYPNLIQFINKIENSQLLNKVQGLSITPSPEIEDQDRVDFIFELESFFQKQQISDSLSIANQIRINSDISATNPFSALIKDNLPPNTTGLINIEQSRIMGITATRIFLRDQEGAFKSLRIGDRVYLGVLQSINMDDRTATFNLDKGGIQELLILEVQR